MEKRQYKPFDGASSNFAASISAQYLKREDFPSVYGVANPVANVIQAFSPMMVAMVGFGMGFHVVFGIVAVLGVIALILIFLINPKHIIEIDNKYKAADGQALEN